MAFDPDSTNASVNITKINNSGTIIGRYGVYIGSHVTLSELYNSGTIGLKLGDVNGLWINSGTITTINNSGTIKSADVGLLNQGTIGTLNNTGTIDGINIGLSNVGTITTINNLQGRGNAIGPIVYTGRLPTNYNVIVNSTSQFGRLQGDSATGAMTFGIYSGGVTGIPASTLTVGTYTSVLTGLVASNLRNTSGTYGAYSWVLVNPSLNNWNLVVSLNSNGGGSGSGGGSSDGSSSNTTTPTTTNITSGTSFGLNSIGVTANPVLAGGTIVLTKGERSSQALSILSAGGTISAPTTGAAQLLGTLSGSGRLTFNGSGMTVLSGANTYTGGTVVDSGTLSLLGGTLGSGDVYVAPGAQLVGTGSIAGPITVAGLIKPGNSPGYLAANASVTMNSGSTYQQDIAGTIQASQVSPVGATGYYSFMNVTGGQFIINSGATLKPALSNLFNESESGYGSTPYTPVLGDRFRIVTADGGISGKFATVTQPAELTAGTQFLTFYNMNGSNSIDLALIPTSYNTTIGTLSGNKNAQSVGGALDKMVVASQAGTSTAAQDQLLYATSGQSASTLSSYAQGLAGEVYAAAVATIAQITQRVQQSVLNRLGDTMGIGLPSSMTNSTGNTDLMANTQATMSGGVATAAVSTNPNAEAKSFNNGNIWGDLAYQKANRSSDEYSGGWNSNLYQLVFGSDFQTESGATIGGGLALSNTNLSPTYGSATIQQGSIFAYGKMPVQEFVVDGMASIGLNSSDISRSDVTGLSNGYRNKSVTGNDAMISLGLSRPFDVNNIRITPFARVTWQIISQAGVNEGETASAISVKGFTGNGVRGMLGIAAGSKANNPMTEQFTYRAYVGVGADSSGVLNPTLNASLAGMGTNITTPNAGATFVQAGLYGTAKIADNVYAYAGLSGEARSGQTLGVINAGIRFQF